jgi:branched-chain amino acid transport system permease protein
MKMTDLALFSGETRSQAVEAREQLASLLPEPVRQLLPVIIGAVLIVIGLFLEAHQMSILNHILILGIFGMAYDLLFGYTGLLSFGHAAFFGTGAYVGIYVTNEFALPFVALLGVAIVVGLVLSVVMGVIALRTTGVYFAMLTLALAQLLYIMARRFEEIGGASGLTAFERPSTFLPLDLGDSFHFFVLTVILLVGSYLLLRRILNSPAGDVLRAIRENEDRAEMVGYSTFRYKVAALAVSGVFSTIAGVMFGLFLFFGSPNFLFWVFSGDVLLLTLFGGAGTLVGPVIGAGFVVLLEEALTPIIDEWRLVLGIVFVLVILFFPRGIAGLFMEED